MSSDKTDGGDHPRVRIHLGEEHEVRFWMMELGVTRKELERAIAKVGVNVDGVRAYLNKSK